MTVIKPPSLVRSGHSSIWAIAMAAAIALTAGCSRTPAEPAPQPAAASSLSAASAAASAPQSPPVASAVASASAASADPYAGTGPNVMWTEPGGWVRLTGGASIRHATYQVPRAEGDSEDGEFAIAYLAGDEAGNAKDTIKRWIGEFSGGGADAVKREERTIADMKQWLVDDSGTYTTSAGPGKASVVKKNFALFGGIVEAPAGKYSFRLTGPKLTVRGARADALRLLDSVHLLRF